MHQVERHRAPREHYVPRALIGADHGRYGSARAYGKKPGADRGRITLPEAWSAICPNRITERRLAAGMTFATDLHRAIGCISYQRLIRMETGRVIIRKSEYELVADALGIHEDMLKLPLLTHAETIMWNRNWGPGKQIEEGGDEDSVVLAAYVRHLVRNTGMSRTSISTSMGFSQHCLIHIWHAEKPIDRWPDSTMMVVMRLAGLDNWDDVITTSRALRADGRLDDLIDEVVQPRVRYAPEDPDRKAPWTYDTDPYRTRERRRQVQTPLSAPPIRETVGQMKRRMADERAEERRRRREAAQRDANNEFSAVIERARTGDQVTQLVELFPDSPIDLIRSTALDRSLAATVIARATLVRSSSKDLELQQAADLLGVSKERLRQIAKADDGTIRSFLPRTRASFQGMIDA